MEKVANNLARVVCRTTGGVNKAIIIEAAHMARFSDGACTCSLGDTSVLVTAVSDSNQKSGASFLPLTVEYRQKAAAAGRIPMTHLRRDMGTTEKEILTSRMVDRSVRPAFGKEYSNETQIICNLLAVDSVNDPDVLAINGASASLAISDIPWPNPIGAARVGLLGEQIVVNPTRKEQENSRLNMVLSATSAANVVMIDGFCREPILISDIMKAIKHGTKECVAIVESILTLQKSIGKPKRPIDTSRKPTREQKDRAYTLANNELREILSNYEHDKSSRDVEMFAVRDRTTAALKDAFPDADPSLFNSLFSMVVKEVYRQLLRESHTRCDGRGFGILRPIKCKVNLYKPLHGSALFQRGQTQVFCSTTFDSPDAAFRQDPMTILMSGIKEKNFMLHYEFPPFATHEIGRVSSFGRREIGHGALAERGLRPVIPESHDFTIRLNCEVLESNGSSSMASVCAGSMSLMDAGVKIKDPVAGVAMGLLSNLSDEFTEDLGEKESEAFILTDILGFEDHIGDMDFKIAGTKKAITALQLDVKPSCGLPTPILYKALQKSHMARTEIINLMAKAIKEPRKVQKENHPVIKTIHVPAHKRSKFLGFGGANLKKMTAQTGVRISSLDEGLDDPEQYGSTLGAKAQDNFILFAPNKDSMLEAEEFINSLLAKEYKEPELEFNAIYTATIQEIRQNGVMITLYPDMKPTLLHLSQLDIKSVSHPDALNLEVGQQIQVKYFGRDPSSGQMRLSRKSLLMSNVSKIHRDPLE